MQTIFSIKPQPKKQKQKPSLRKLNTACVRCKRRHIKCDGESNCANCVKTRTVCEYVQADKKIVISQKHLTRLQDSICQLKHENSNIKNLLKQCLQKLEESGLKLDSIDVRDYPNPPILNNNNDDIDDNNNDNNDKNDKNGNSNDIETKGMDTEVIVIKEKQINEKLMPRNTFYPFLNKSGYLKDESNVHKSSQTLISQSMCKLLEIGKTPLQINKLDSRSEGFNENIIISKINNEITIIIHSRLSENSETVTINLPTYAEAITLLDAFIAFNDASIYFFNEGLVRENLKRIYESNNFIIPLEYCCGQILNNLKISNLYVAIFICKIMMIFSISELYQDSSSYDKLRDIIISTESKMFSDTKRLFLVLFGAERLEYSLYEGGIETLLLYSFYLENNNQIITSHSYLSIAIQSALVLGMHVDYGKAELSRCELEHRRRLFWSLMLRERLLANSYGFSITLMDCDITAELPQDYDTSCFSNSFHYIFPDSEIINSFLEINKINTLVINELYNKRPGSNILTSIKDMVVNLLRWKRTVPVFIDCDYSKGKITLTRLIGSLMNEYFQGLNLAVRPLLLHVASAQVATNTNEATYLNLSDCAPIILALLNASFQASMNSIRTFWNLYNIKHCFLKGHSDVQYLYNASSTLLLFSASFGVHSVTSWHIDHALTILTRMKKAGNPLASIRASQILELVSKFNNNGVMNNIIEKFTVRASVVSTSIENKHDYIQKITRESGLFNGDSLNASENIFQAQDGYISQNSEIINSREAASQSTLNSSLNGNFINYFANDNKNVNLPPTTTEKPSPRIAENFSPFFVPDLLSFGDKITDFDLSAALEVFGDDSDIFKVFNI